MASKIDKLMKIEASIISNAQLFKISYLPKDILERSETEALYKGMSTFVTYKTPSNILLVGDPGTGKTVTASFIAERMPSIESSIEVIYVNCHNKTTHEVLSFLTHGHTLGTSSSEIIGSEFLTKRINKNTLIILDEIDKGYKINDLLYLLSRPKEHYSQMPFEISLILISNKLYWEDELPSYLRSSLQLKKILFMPYTADQLKQILKYRIKFGFLRQESLPEELLDMIISLVVENKHADCRVALKTVFLSAKNAELRGRTIIEEADVKSAYKEAVQEIESERLSALTHNHFLMLMSCSHGKQTLDEIYGEYMELFKQFHTKDWKPLKPTAFYNSLDYLDSQGLIKKEIDVKKDPNTPPIKTLTCTLRIDEKIVKKELDNRLIKHENRLKEDDYD